MWGEGDWTACSGPANMSLAEGGVLVWRDSHSSEVWHSVSGYSCRSDDYPPLKFHSPHLLQSTQESCKVSFTHRTKTHINTRTNNPDGSPVQF